MRAIILAAGKSNRFAPFTYEKPKGLFIVRGEVIIERQIRQLHEAGVSEIYVVVGYMKEKFFYLEEKFGVKLLINNNFSEKGNLLSVYIARNYLENSYICCADHYFVENIFVNNDTEKSYRFCSFLKGRFREFSVSYSDADVITEVIVGGVNNSAMVGPAFFNEALGRAFRRVLENEIDGFGVAGLFWEEFYGRHIKEFTLYRKDVSNSLVFEFDSIEDLRQFDADFLLNVSSGIVSNICKVLKCHPNEILDINVIRAGLTNVSFSFRVKDEKFVYRHPGGTAGALIDRSSEIVAEKVASSLNLDPTLIYMDEAGWKISYFIDSLVECNLRKVPWQLKKGIAGLKRLHHYMTSDEHIRIFDDVIEGKKLMEIASRSKGDLFGEFSQIISRIERLNELAEHDALELGYKRVLCHNDLYEPNYLATEDGNLYLIDWEYAGLNYPANDLACLFCRDDYDLLEIDHFLQEYFGRPLSLQEDRFFKSYIAICAFYWFCWGLYKGSVGDDDGFFFLPSYRNCIKYTDMALKSYAE